MLLGWLCPVCDEPGLVPCEPCRADMERAPALVTPAGLDHLLALLRYEGAARELVARIKYRNRRSAISWLAAGMAELVQPVLLDSIEVVTWAPATPQHVRKRGYDHGRLLAEAVARHLRRPCSSLLTRAVGPGLTGRDAAQRRELGVRLVSRSVAAGSGVLLVDDVVTTGTTMAAAGAALRGTGAGSVVGLAAARTPATRRGLPE